MDIHDPLADADIVFGEYNIELQSNLVHGAYDAIVFCVAHDQYLDLGYQTLRSYGREHAIFYDLKHAFDDKEIDAHL